MNNIILTVLAVAVTAAVIGTISAKPNNKAVKIGQNAELEFDFGASPPTDRKWTKDSTPTEEVADDGTTTGNQKYDATVTSNVWKLTIKNVIKDDGELYTCSSASTSKSASANLVILGTPTCSVVDEASDKIRFTCEIDYGGNLVPELKLEQSDLTLDSTGGTPSGGKVSHYSDVAAPGADGKTFSCSVTFEGINLPTAPAGIDVTTKPTYAETCTVQAAKPAGITISSGDGNDALVASDVLTCAVSAAGNPQGSFKWTDEADAEIGTDATYTVSSSLADKTVRCTASNNVGSATAIFPASAESTETPAVTEITDAPFTGGSGTLKYFTSSLVLTQVLSLSMLEFLVFM